MKLVGTISRTEASVVVVVTLQRGPDGTARLIAFGQSLDAGGDVVRVQPIVDITDDVPAGTRTGAENLLSNIEARLKGQWNIS